MKVHTFLLACSASLVIAACGGKAKPAGGGGTEPTQAGPTGPLAAGQWESMGGKDRAMFMKNVVYPTMGDLFRSFDGEEFGEFRCETCHGKGVDDHSFEMPNPDLPALSGDMIAHPDEDHVAITEFMATKVKPTMAQLLGVPERGPDNPDGFGCFACHPMAE